MSGRLQPSARLFVGLEYDDQLFLEQDEQHQLFKSALDGIVRQEFGAYFPDATFHRSMRPWHKDQWFTQSQNQAPGADYILVVRLVSFASGNLVRHEKCPADDTHESQEGQSSIFSRWLPFSPAPEGHRPEPQSLPEHGHRHGHEGVHLSETSVLDRLIDQFDIEVPESESSGAVAQSGAALAPAAKTRVDLDKGQAQTELQVKSQTRVVEETKAASPEAKHPVVGVEGGEKRASSSGDVSSADCGIKFGSGKDEVQLTATLYAGSQGLLIDQAQLRGRAGILGWQTKTLKDLLRAQVRKLARRYAGAE